GQLLLTHRAEERRAAGLHHAPDGAVAARRGARLALAVVDTEVVLEVSELAVGAAVIAQRGAAGLDCRLEHGLDGIDQRLRALVGGARSRRDRGGPPLGRKPGAVERLADVDIA